MSGVSISSRGYGMVGICSVLHFLVDGLCLCCAYLLTAPFSLQSSSFNILEIFLTYNILAFLTQPLTGWVADRISQKHWLMIGAVVLLSLAVLLTPIAISSGTATMMFTVAILLGIGNSLFHVWGGKQVVMKVGNDIRALGVFVSTGAFGLAVATVFFSWTCLYIILLAIILLATTYVLMDLPHTNPSTSYIEHSKHHLPQGGMWGAIAIAAIAAFVMFRSYIGTEFSFGSEKSDAVILAIGFTSMLGKIAGGWISRWLGIVRALIVMIVVVLVCMLSGSKELVVVLIGLFMINCTMPITLYLANYVLPGREGLAFGILAAALMPGYMLTNLK